MKLDSLKGPLSPPLYDTLIGLKQDVLRNLRVCVPGTVIAYDPTNRTADIQIALLQQNSNGSSSPYPQLLGCPVITLQGGGVSAAFPIAAGDECLIFFADRCVDAWFQTGSPQPLPNFRMHDLSDGFALVGVNSLGSVLDTALLTGEGGISDDQARVAILAGKIAISNQAQSLFLILTTLLSALSAMTTASVASGATQALIAPLVAQLAALLYP